MKKLKRFISRLPELLREWIWLGHYMKRYWLSIAFYIVLGLLGVGMGLIVQYAQAALIGAVTPVFMKSEVIQWIIVAIFPGGQPDLHQCRSHLDIHPHQHSRGQ